MSRQHQESSANEPGPSASPRDDAIFRLSNAEHLPTLQISAAFHLSVSTINRILAALDARGYVARICVDPARATFLIFEAPLTEPEAEQLLKDYASEPALSPAERAVALDWLDRNRPAHPYPELPQSH